jgi:hypothetical protein
MVRRKAGRPHLDFFADSDRYAVALLDGMLAHEWGTAYACAVGVAALMIGKPDERAAAAFKFKDGRRYLAIKWYRRKTIAGAGAATLRGFAMTLLGKQRRCRTNYEGVWRRWMASAWMATIGARDRERAKAAVLERASAVDEAEFARLVLWPMIDARFSGQFCSTPADSVFI